MHINVHAHFNKLFLQFVQEFGFLTKSKIHSQLLNQKTKVMWKIYLLAFWLIADSSFAAVANNLDHNKVVCFWNSTAFYRHGKCNFATKIHFYTDKLFKNKIFKLIKRLFFAGPAKFEINDLNPALSLCTHLVYGYAGIDANTFEAIPLTPALDTGAGYGFYRLVTQLKKTHPDLRVYLSIGGNADPYEETHKYLKLVCEIVLLYNLKVQE